MRTGIYIDSDNFKLNGGRKARYEAIRRFFEASGPVVQMHAYLAFNEGLAVDNPDYASWHARHLTRISAAGFRTHCKPCKSYQQANGGVVTKGNCDVELTVDVMMHASRLDRVVLVTGDGDFVRLVHALQDQGVRVEVLAISNVSGELKEACDSFVQAALVPDIFSEGFEPGQQVVEVTRVNRTTMVAEYRGLNGFPASISVDDPAWVTEAIQLSAAMFDSKAFMPGSLALLTKESGRSANIEPFSLT